MKPINFSLFSSSFAPWSLYLFNKFIFSFKSNLSTLSPPDRPAGQLIEWLINCLVNRLTSWLVGNVIG
jgi:hypothetical protein